MFNKLAFAAILTAILAASASAAPAPRQGATVPSTGAEQFQSRGNTEDDMGLRYRGH
jgi:hypothetical protein